MSFSLGVTTAAAIYCGGYGRILNQNEMKLEWYMTLDFKFDSDVCIECW